MIVTDVNVRSKEINRLEIRHTEGDNGEEGGCNESDDKSRCCRANAGHIPRMWEKGCSEL